MVDDPPTFFPCIEPLRCRLHIVSPHYDDVTENGTRFLTSHKLDGPLTMNKVRSSNCNQEFVIRPTRLPDRADPVHLIYACSHGGVLAVVEGQLQAVARNQADHDPTVDLCALQVLRNHKGYRIRTLTSGRYVACDLNHQEAACAAWKMEILSGELCFLSISLKEPGGNRLNKNISCNWLGNLSLIDSFSGCEVWRLVEVGEPGSHNHFWINSWTHGDCVLCSDGDGKVSTVNRTFPVSSATKWTVEIPGSPGLYGVLLQSVETGMYLALKRDKSSSPWQLCTTRWTSDSLTCSTYWVFEPANRNVFRIFTNAVFADSCSEAKETQNECPSQPLHPQYLSVEEFADENTTLKMHSVHCTPQKRESSEWKLEYTSDGTVSLLFREGKPWSKVLEPHGYDRDTTWYLEVGKYGKANLSKRAYFWSLHGSMSGVVIQPEGDDMSCLILDHGTNVLGAYRSDNLHTTETWLWTLRPCLPDKGMTGLQVKSLTLTGHAAAGTFFVAPWSISHAGGAPSVTSSLTVGMMPAAGYVGGAGTAETWLGSIGTTRLVAVGDGALTGQTIAGLTSVMACNEGASMGSTDHSQSSSSLDDVAPPNKLPFNRPFAGWQHWKARRKPKL